jgi:4-hydroxy-tetrahydrodipicolinate reductase
MPGDVALAIFGAGGRLGSRIVELARDQSGCTVVHAAEHPRHVQLGKPVPGLEGRSYISDATALSGVDVAVDVSLPEAVADHVRTALNAKVPLLVATTGLSPHTMDAIRDAARSIAVCVAPNLSPGVWVLASLVKQAAHILAGYDVEVTETHHRHKRDAPSGTALLLARHAALGRGTPLEGVMDVTRTSDPKVRIPGSIGMASLRGGDVVGDHTVMLLGDGERLELTHRAHSRDTFARGALRLAPLLKGKPAGQYSVPQLLGLPLD